MSAVSLPLYGNSLATMIVRGSSGAARFAAFLLIARQYGPSAFGEFTLAFSVVEISRIVGEFGLDTVLVRKIAAEPQTSPTVVNNAITFKLLSSACVSLLIFLIYGVAYGGSGMHLLAIFIPSIFATLVSNVLIAYFQAHLKMAQIVFPSLVSAGSYLVLTLLFLLWHAPLPIVAAAFTVSEFVALALVVRRTKQHLAIRTENDIALIGNLIKESSFVALSGLIVVVYLRFDVLVIGALLGNRDLGEYSLAFRLTEPFQLLFSSLSLSLFASLSGLWRRAEFPAIWQTIRKVLYPTAAIAGGAMVLLSLVIAPLLRLYASEYARSHDVLIILSIALLFKALNAQLTAILNSLGKYRTITLITVVNLLLCVILNLILIPPYGVIGAAAVVAGVELFNLLMQGSTVGRAVRRLHLSENP